MSATDTNISDFNKIVEDRVSSNSILIFIFFMSCLGYWFLAHQLNLINSSGDKWSIILVSALIIIVAGFSAFALFKIIKNLEYYKSKNTIRLCIGDEKELYFECGKGNPTVRDSIYLKIARKGNAKIIAFYKAHKNKNWKVMDIINDTVNISKYSVIAWNLDGLEEKVSGEFPISGSPPTQDKNFSVSGKISLLSTAEIYKENNYNAEIQEISIRLVQDFLFTKADIKSLFIEGISEGLKERSKYLNSKIASAKSELDNLRTEVISGRSSSLGMLDNNSPMARLAERTEATYAYNKKLETIEAVYNDVLTEIEDCMNSWWEKKLIERINNRSPDERRLLEVKAIIEAIGPRLTGVVVNPIGDAEKVKNSIEEVRQMISSLHTEDKTKHVSFTDEAASNATNAELRLVEVLASNPATAQQIAQTMTARRSNNFNSSTAAPQATADRIENQSSENTEEKTRPW